MTHDILNNVRQNVEITTPNKKYCWHHSLKKISASIIIWLRLKKNQQKVRGGEQNQQRSQLWRYSAAYENTAVGKQSSVVHNLYKFFIFFCQCVIILYKKRAGSNTSMLLSEHLLSIRIGMMKFSNFVNDDHRESKRVTYIDAI